MPIASLAFGGSLLHEVPTLLSVADPVRAFKSSRFAEAARKAHTTHDELCVPITNGPGGRFMLWYLQESPKEDDGHLPLLQPAIRSQ